jgi:hypothetical protein
MVLLVDGTSGASLGEALFPEVNDQQTEKPQSPPPPKAGFDLKFASVEVVRPTPRLLGSKC